jgi:hypothetical protein
VKQAFPAKLHHARVFAGFDVHNGLQVMNAARPSACEKLTQSALDRAFKLFRRTFSGRGRDRLDHLELSKSRSQG